MSPGSSSPPSDERDLVARHLAEQLDDVLRVEADRDRLAVVLGLELLANLAEVRVVARDGDAVLGRSDLHAARLRRHQLRTPERVDEARAVDGDDLLVVLRDHLLVRRELRVDELHRERDVVLDEEQVRRLDGELAARSRLEDLANLEQALLRDDDACRELGAVRDRALDLRQAVTVRRDHARLAAVALEEHAVEVEARLVVADARTACARSSRGAPRSRRVEYVRLAMVGDLREVAVGHADDAIGDLARA